MPSSKTLPGVKRVIAGWVRNFRRDRKVSQEELAAHLDCSARQLQKIETGTANPSASWLGKFSAAMKEDVRHRFIEDVATAAAREAQIKELRRPDTSL